MFFYGCFFSALHDSYSIIVLRHFSYYSIFLLLYFLITLFKLYIYSYYTTGHGRYDVRIEFRNVNKAIVFEFKKSQTRDKLEDDAEKALFQCMTNQYVADLPKYQCLLIGVSFLKKEMSKLHFHVQ